MGGARMLATMAELDIAGVPAYLRPFRSLDNGLTWTELATLIAQENVASGLFSDYLRSTGVGNHVLQGMRGPLAVGVYEPGASVLIHSENGGDAWASGLSGAEYAADNFAFNGWQTTDFIVTDLGVIFALIPPLPSGGPDLVLMQSIDGGLTFTTLTALTPLLESSPICGAYLGGGILLAGEDVPEFFLGQHGRAVDRSIDGGATWTRLLLDGANQGPISGACRVGALGSGLALLAGALTTGHFQSGDYVYHGPRMYWSIDAGATWTLGTISGTADFATDIIAPSTVFAVIGLRVQAADMALGGSPFRLSIDGGHSFLDQGAQATAFTPGVGYRVTQLAVSDDGAVLAAVQTGPDGDNTQPAQIWRGVIAGFAGPGPCAGFPSIGSPGALFRARAQGHLGALSISARAHGYR